MPFQLESGISSSRNRQERSTNGEQRESAYHFCERSLAEVWVADCTEAFSDGIS